MRFTTGLRRTAAGVIGVTSLTLMGLQSPASAVVVAGDGPACVETGHGEASASARGGHGANDTRPVSAEEQRQIRETYAGGGSPVGPRCGVAMTARPIGGGSFGLGYARRREWLMCPQCRRSALFDVRRGTRN